MILGFWNIWRSRTNGEVAGDDPWGAPSLEWSIPSPPPDYNFAVIPKVTSRYPLWDVKSPELTADVPHSKHGDERNDVELAAMGVARNDTERALIARMRAQQQIRDAGILGKIAGKVTGDWDRLKESRDRIDELLGLPEGAVDAMGRLKALGANINPDGSVKPPAGGSGAELELAMHMTHLTAESYKTMTDKLFRRKNGPWAGKNVYFGESTIKY